MGYSAHSLEGYNTGNSRNGYYARQLDTKYGRLHLKIPRDRQGQFKPALIPEHSRRTGDLEDLVIRLYAKGMTTSEMANIIEKPYGHHYSPATVANITKLTEQSVLAFHERQLRKKLVFQNEVTLDCFLVTQFDLYNRSASQRRKLDSVIAKTPLRAYLSKSTTSLLTHKVIDKTH